MRQVNPTKNIPAPSIKDKAKIVKEAPTGPDWEVVTENGEEFYKKKSESSTPRRESGGVRHDKLKAPIVKKTGTPTKTQSSNSRVIQPTEKKAEEYVRVVKDSVPPPVETNLYGDVSTYERLQPKKTANQFYETRTYPNAEGNFTNDAINVNFIGDKEVTFDNNGNPVYTGKTVKDYRDKAVQQIEKPNFSGVNKINTDTVNNFSQPNTNFSKNQSGGLGLTPPTATDKYVPVKYDSLGKEIPAINTGLRPVETPAKESNEVGKMYPKLKKGGVVNQMKGYLKGGGVTGDTNGDGYLDALEKQNLDAKNTKTKNNISAGLGAVGATYYGSQQPQNEGEAVYNTGMQTVGQFGGIGKAIQGGAALGDMIGKPIRKSTEGYNKNTGEYNDMGNAKTAGAIGSHFNPFKSLTTILTDKDASNTTKIKAAVTGGAEGTGSYYKDKENARKARIEKATNEVNAVNGQNKALQAIAARNANEFNPKITTLYNTNNMQFDENQNAIFDGQVFDKNRMYKKGGLVNKMQSCAKGGEIKGSGTGTSDSIKAKIKPGSFVVPAKNAEIAEELREEVLDKTPKPKADLNQKGGAPVKLSNKEHLFTPEEKQELLMKGVNVDLLAPESEEKAVQTNKNMVQFPKVVGLKNGGEPAKRDKTYVKAPLIRSKAEIEYMKKVSEAQKAREKILADELAKGNTVMAIPGGEYEGDSTFLYPNESKFSSVGRRYIRTQMGARLEGVNPYDEKELWMNNPNIKLRQDSGEYKALDVYKGYAKGGNVVDPKTELAKIKAERDAIANIEKKREADRTQAEKNALQKFVMDARAKDKADKTSQWEKKYNDAKTKHDALTKAYEETVKGFDAMGNATSKDRKIGISGTKDAEYQRKTKEDILKKLSDAKDELTNAERTYKYVKSDSYGKTNATAPKTDVKVSETKPTTVVKAETKPTVKAPTLKRTGDVATTGKFVAPKAEYNPTDEITVPVKETVVDDTVSADNAKKLADSAFAADVNNNPALKTNPKQKKGIADYLGNIDPTSLVGPMQTVMGFNSLRGEKRPVDDSKLDPIYNQSVDRSIQDAKFGLTPENRFLMEQAQQNALNDSRYSARNFAGGNAGTAFNQERQAINSGLAAKLGLRVADQDLRMQKQQYADAQIANRAQIESQMRRQKFNDAMGAYQQKQQAGSELIGAGLANTIGAYRYNKELTEEKRRNDLDWSRNYG